MDEREQERMRGREEGRERKRENKREGGIELEGGGMIRREVEGERWEGE